MVIALIHWKIKLGEEHRRAFLDHWEKALTINERSHLIGEFLSQPVAAQDAGFPCGLLGLPSSPAYQSFFNVGLRSDLDAFRKHVIEPFVGRAPKPQEFRIRVSRAARSQSGLKAYRQRRASRRG